MPRTRCPERSTIWWNSSSRRLPRAQAAAGDPLDNAIRANVAIGVERLKGLEPILAGPVNEGKVKVVGAVYDLRDGKVTMVA